VAASFGVLLGWIHAGWNGNGIFHEPESREFSLRHIRNKFLDDQVISPYDIWHLRRVNMVFRYEMTWQNFFKLEQKLSNQLGKALDSTSHLQGVLEIDCNDFSKPIQYDTNDGGRYEVKEFVFPKNLIAQYNTMADENLLGTQEHEPQWMCNRYVQEVQNAANGGQGMQDTVQGQMLAMAYDFPYVVYSIQYGIETYFHSVLLDVEKVKESFSFFPFRRPLYHAAEAELDSVIWEKLEKAAEYIVTTPEYLYKRRGQILEKERKKRATKSTYDKCVAQAETRIAQLQSMAHDQ
jgi:hypothetical protein